MKGRLFSLQTKIW